MSVMMAESTGFHDRLRAAMGGISQAELSRRTGVAQSALNRIVAGGDPSFTSLIAIANALQVTVGWLVGETSGPTGLTALEAEARLAAIEASFNHAMPEHDVPERGELTEIALDQTLPDRVRAAADTLLYVAFGDEHAAARRSAREKRQSAFGRRARLAINEAASRAGWTELPARVAAGLERVVTLDQDAPDEVVSWVLEDLLSVIHEGYDPER